MLLNDYNVFIIHDSVEVVLSSSIVKARKKKLIKFSDQRKQKFNFVLTKSNRKKITKEKSWRHLHLLWELWEGWVQNIVFIMLSTALKLLHFSMDAEALNRFSNFFTVSRHSCVSAHVFSRLPLPQEITLLLNTPANVYECSAVIFSRILCVLIIFIVTRRARCFCEREKVENKELHQWIFVRKKTDFSFWW